MRFPLAEVSEPLSGTKKVNGKALRCISNKLILTSNQKLIIDDWFFVYRWVYNGALKLRKKDNTLTSLPKLRRAFLKEMKDQQTYFWRICSSHILSEAISDVCKSYKTCWSHVKLGLIRRFRVRYKKLHKPLQTICIPSSMFSKRHNSFCFKKLGIIKSEFSLKGQPQACRLTRDSRRNLYILNMPCQKETYEMKDRKKICSLDPGIRTFQTLYSKDHVHEFGKNTYKKIGGILKRISRAKGSAEKFTNRLYDRAKNIIKDMQWKTALKLVQSFDTILVGNMSTKSICRGRLNKKTKSIAMMFSHYTFNCRLMEKAAQYGSKVIIVDEAWTSKTCGGCTTKNMNLGASKIFTCESCNFVWDRDFNGARNIMKRYYGLI